MDFYQWLISNKNLSTATASKYDLVIKNRIREWLPSYELPKDSIEFEALKQTIFDLEIYQERNRIGNHMYSSALKHYGDYLKLNDLSNLHIFDQNQTLTSEAKRLVSVRLTQNKFRKALFDLHPYCAITGFNQNYFLVASHIKPWRKCNDTEKVDPYNGLLLTPNFDRLFDQGLITIDNSGTIITSKILKEEFKVYFQIPQKLNIALTEHHYKYLEFHAKEIFQN